MHQSENMDETTLIADLYNTQKHRMVNYCILLADTSDATIRIMLQDLLMEASEDQFALLQLLQSQNGHPSIAPLHDVEHAKLHAQHLKQNL